MLIYIWLIISIIASSIFIKINVRNKEKQESIILFCGMIMLFLILALKKETVGVDITGYRVQYELSRKISWKVWDYVYFENGYIVLQKVFSKIGISFQVFTMILYAFFCSILYFFVKKYSKNVTISLLIFICYQFFVFSISGLRQTVAMGICLIAFMIDYEKKKTLKAIGLIILAMQIHSSAVVFLIVPIVMRLEKKRVDIYIWNILVLMCILGRKYFWKIISYFYGLDVETAVLGGNMLLVLGIAIFAIFTYYFSYKSNAPLDNTYIRIAFLSVISYFVLCGSTLLRASMYFNLFYIVLIPHFIEKYRTRDRMLLNILMTTFLIILFYKETLSINQLEICPYKFFWQ